MKDSLQGVDFIVERLFITKLPLVFIHIQRVDVSSLTYEFCFS